MPQFVFRSRLSWLLVLVPLSLAIDLLGFSQLLLFVVSAVAVIPLAGLIGQATEQLSLQLGPGMGGFLNATFGNAPELIIGLFALASGLSVVVKAAISGSIIGNILLSLGLSMLLGGWGRKKQTFNRTAAGANAAMLFLAAVALIMPAIFDLATFGTLSQATRPVYEFSLLVAAVLLLTYLASLVFSLRTHRYLFAVAFEPSQALLTPRSATALLLATTAVMALEAEILVSAIAVATEALRISQFFVGVIVVAIVGNAAEYYSALMASLRGNMELAMSIASSSATQIALFVTPVLIFASFLLGRPATIILNAFEISGVVVAVLILAIVSLDGESNWFEGLELIAVYVVLAIIFYFVPTA